MELPVEIKTQLDQQLDQLRHDLNKKTRLINLLAQKETTIELTAEIKTQLDQLRQAHPEIWGLTYSQLLKLLQEAMQQKTTDNPEEMSANECAARGQALLGQGRWQEAEPFLFDALEKAEQSNDLKVKCGVIRLLARLYRDRVGDREERKQAMIFYQQALSLAEQLDEMWLQSAIYDEIGTLHCNQGNYSKAIEHSRKGLEIAKKLGDEQGQAAILCNLGNVYNSQGDFGQAIEVYQNSLTLSLKLGADIVTVPIYNNLATIYVEQGHYSLALEMAQNSLVIQERMGGHAQCQAESFFTLGNIYYKQGAFDEAIQMYEKALALIKRIGEQQGIAKIYNNLANVYIQKGDTAQTLENYRKALDIMEHCGDHHGAAETYFNLGLIYGKAIGDLTVARQHFEKAKALYELMGDAEHAQQAARELRSL